MIGFPEGLFLFVPAAPPTAPFSHQGSPTGINFRSCNKDVRNHDSLAGRIHWLLDVALPD